MAETAFRNLRTSTLCLALPECVVAVLLAFALRPLSYAAVITTGDVSPDPTTTTNTTPLFVGQSAPGTMIVNGASSVTSGNSYIGHNSPGIGGVTITDVGSLWTTAALYVGNNGTGELHVLDGATVVSSSGVVGNLSTASASATISGAGSLWKLGSLQVGSASATLTISNGGQVLGTVVSIGNGSGTGSASVDGIGSQLNTSSFYLGSNGEGTVSVTNGGLVTSTYAWIGQYSNHTSSMSLSGPQSAWHNSGDATVGLSGTGILRILQGSTVDIGGSLIVTDASYSSSSRGEIHFENSSLNTGGLLTRFSDLYGTGTINTNGLVADINLTFDDTHALQQQFALAAEPGQNILLNLDQNGLGPLGAGLRAQGTLNIYDGQQLSSNDGYLGYYSGANGVAVVDGPSTQWEVSRNLYVGRYGTGTLTIQNGAHVAVGNTTSVRAGTLPGKIFLNDGVLSTRTLRAGREQLRGAGTINTHGWRGAGNLIFDQSHPLQQQIVVSGEPGQNITVNLDVDGTGELGAGYTSPGSLTIADGLQAASTYGYIAGSSMANVTGANSRWSISGILWIYDPTNASAKLMIADGAAVINGGADFSNGTVTVSGGGSLWQSTRFLRIGSIGLAPAELRVLSGGTVFSVDNGLTTFASYPGSGLGLDSSGVGIVVVDGASSTWTHSGQLTIGAEGSGQMTISNAGVVNFTSAVVADGSPSSNDPVCLVTVTGVGSTWNSGPLTLGRRKNAALTISSGGAVHSSSAILALNSLNSRGTVTLADPGSSWSVDGALSIGGDTSNGGNADVSIGLGALLRVGGTTTIFNRGKLKLNGGTLTASTINFVGATNQFTWASGTLHVTNFNNNLTNSAGILAPGEAVGTTTIGGTFAQQSGGTLQIDIGGTTAGTQFDVVNVTGATVLGGALRLGLLDGFIPTAADTFAILNSTGAVTGAFANVANSQRLLTTDGLGTFQVNYGAASALNTRQVVLSAFVIAGDFNVDGIVDAADYIVWRNTLGTTITPFNGADATGNGVVDDSDLQVWRSHLGRAATLGGETAIENDLNSTPEPATGTLITLLALSHLMTIRYTSLRPKPNRFRRVSV